MKTEDLNNRVIVNVDPSEVKSGQVVFGIVLRTDDYFIGLCEFSWFLVKEDTELRKLCTSGDLKEGEILHYEFVIARNNKSTCVWCMIEQNNDVYEQLKNDDIVQRLLRNM
jgi:hypothetical protein